MDSIVEPPSALAAVILLSQNLSRSGPYRTAWAITTLSREEESSRLLRAIQAKDSLFQLCRIQSRVTHPCVENINDPILQ